MKKTILLFFLFIAGQLIANIFIVLSVVFNNADHIEQLSLQDFAEFTSTQIAISMLLSSLFIIFVLWRTRWAGNSIRSLWESTYKAKDIATVAGFLLLGLGINILLTPLDLPDHGMLETFKRLKDNALAIFFICFIGPIIEEIVFRDGILRHLRLAGYSSPLALLISSLLFGIIHANLAQAIPATLLGLLLGILYLKTNSLKLCVWAHVINNIAAWGLMFFPEIDTTARQSPLSFILLISTGFFILGGGLFISGCANENP